VATAEEASAISIINGEDLNCGNTFQQYCKSAIDKGLMTEAHLDTALVRVFEARFSVGEFDSNNPFANSGDGMLECDDHRALALQASKEAIVLLKNSNSLLPLDASKVSKIAVIGPYGNAIQLGGYSGTPTYQKTIFSQSPMCQSNQLPPDSLYNAS
jgi:beta-glucosidase